MDDNALLEMALDSLSDQYPIETHRSGCLLRIKAHDVEHRFNAIVISRIDKATVALYMAKTGHTEQNIIITPYVSPNMADHLRENNISFIDTSGNMFLNKPPLFMFVKGNKKQSQLKPVPVIRAFKTAGLKVLFTLLSLPDSEKRPFRELAFLSNVSVGTVDWVMKDLKTIGHLSDMGKHGRRLIRKKELVQRWVASFPEQLRTKLSVKTFRPEHENWWKNVSIETSGAMWSGEAAAAKMTGYLSPQIVTMYAKAPYTRLVVEHKLRRDDQGNVEILDRFWNFESQLGSENIVPPLLIYADLMVSGDARNVETAGMIYHDHIAQRVRED